jgi:catalase
LEGGLALKGAKELAINTEYPAPNEDEVAGRIVQLLRRTVEQRFLQGMTYRGVNTKSHAAARATVIVDPDLPEHLRVGLFKTPRTYSAWIRFSSTLPDPLPDNDKDLRGLAIKLMDVDGATLLEPDSDARTHDLIFITPNTFFTSTPEDFLSFVEAGSLNKKKSLRDMFRTFIFMLAHPAVLICIMKAQQRIGSLLEVPWYSATPYLFGDRAVKYSLSPWQKPRTPIPKSPANNYLREDLARQLKEGEAGFDLRIQFQLDPYKQPIEDALVPWREQDSPWHKLATVVLPKQVTDSPEQLVFCENLSMNPWRCFPEHRPLGGVNRARRKIYYEGSKYRHHKNAVPVVEPKP